ncbi:ribosomal protein L23 [Tritrichomonas foetus]|uniref:Ribosomal protein L23 n=1 Tax=Tritrichomonas foetus TaxID=1144522 RepID=A0A1J4JAR9_9EUKA|nr:ribosomal protein L23 [Tritrichomonas foetus]|eukprot:OHS94356.1 ribosomal protein L23 [Tritrichomonas foetus]
MSGQAEAAAKNVAKGQQKQVKKVRHFQKFHKPSTVTVPRKPIYEHKAVQPVSIKRNDYKIIRGPVTSDKASRKVEDENTLVFWVDLRATKTEIAAAVNRLYKVKPVKISTLVTAKCLKKAYVRLPAEFEAMNIANEMA